MVNQDGFFWANQLKQKISHANVALHTIFEAAQEGVMQIKTVFTLTFSDYLWVCVILLCELVTMPGYFTLDLFLTLFSNVILTQLVFSSFKYIMTEQLLIIEGGSDSLVGYTCKTWSQGPSVSLLYVINV